MLNSYVIKLYNIYIIKPKLSKLKYTTKHKQTTYYKFESVFFPL